MNDLFLDEYEELCIKHGVIVTACYDDPWVIMCDEVDIREHVEDLRK
jgi:hypothetical protein